MHIFINILYIWMCFEFTAHFLYTAACAQCHVYVLFKHPHTAPLISHLYHMLAWTLLQGCVNFFLRHTSFLYIVRLSFCFVPPQWSVAQICCGETHLKKKTHTVLTMTSFWTLVLVAMAAAKSEINKRKNEAHSLSSTSAQNKFHTSNVFGFWIGPTVD